MLNGRSLHKTDSKGRLALPSRMRDAGVGVSYSQFVVTKGIGGCIAVFPVDKFERFLNEFDPGDMSQEKALNFYREFSSWAHRISVDSQGRINLPQMLIDEAGITDEVLILGVVDWIELWEPAQYRRHLEESKVDYDQGAMPFFSSAIRGRRKENDEQSPECSD